MHNHIIRAARTEDLPAISAIYADAVAHLTSTFDLEPPSDIAMTYSFAAIAGAGYPWLVAERDGKVTGYAYAAPARARLGWRWTLEDSIYVANDARGLGIGKALLSALIAQAEAQGFRQIIAAIGDSQNAASIALHQSVGFVDAGIYRGVGHKHGRWLDVVLMQKTLGAGDASPPGEIRLHAKS